MAVKEAYTTQDLVPLLKVSRQAIEKRIAREKWQARERARCGSREWLVSSMPEETRVAIRAAEEKQALALCPAPAPIPALSPSTTTAIMDDKRRYKALARAAEPEQGRGSRLAGNFLLGLLADLQPA